MQSPVRELKVRAEILHHRLQAGDPASPARLRALPELRRAGDVELAGAAARIQRKHCLAVVARELGFASFEHAQRVLEGDAAEADFGTLLYGEASGAYLNHWFATYDEARAQQEATSGTGPRQYLLAYKRHCFLAERGFVEALGLDADDADWAAIGWDWVRPRDPEARRRLYARRLAALREPASERAPAAS
jgi:hypothetical protein